MRLVCREINRVKMFELGSVYDSKIVQRLHRPSISNNAGEAFFVKYFVGI